MKKIYLIGILILGSILFANAQELNLKLMSYNMQQPYGTDWDARKATVASVLNNQNADIVGTQELHAYMRDYLLQNATGYESYGLGRDGGEAGEGSFLFYKTAKYTLDAANSGNFWLSNTPETPSRFGGSYNRICSYVRLVENSSGQGFYIFNIHNYMPGEYDYRLAAAKLLSQRIESRTINDPVWITGDFNSSEGDGVTVWMKSGADNTNQCRDTYRDYYPTGSITTGFGTKFDYIYCPDTDNYSTSNSYTVSPSGSDHLPILAEVSFTGNNMDPTNKEIKALTQNLWRRNDTWPSRLNNIVSMISDQAPDFVAITEGDEGKAPEVANLLGSYTLETGPWNDESTCILFNHSTLSIVETGVFGYSSTPDINQTSDWGDGAVYGWLRKCNWVLFEQIASGERFYVYNNHFDALNSTLGPAYWRLEQAKLMADRIAARSYQQYPFIVIGDLNEHEDGNAIDYLKSGKGNSVQMKDTYREILPGGDGYTFGTIKLDYILTEQNSSITTVDANIVYQTNYGNLSDHNAIWAVLELSEVTLTPTIFLSQPEPIYEGDENGKTITVELTNDQFANALNINGWSIGNLPAGVTSGAVTRISSTQAILTLSGNSTIGTYAGNITNVSVTIDASQIEKSTNNVSVNTGVVLTKYIDPDAEALFTNYDGIDLSFSGFGGATFTKIANPVKGGINTSDHVGEFVKANPAETWAGVFSTTLSSKIDFSSNFLIKMKVYSPIIGSMLLKIEDAANDQVFKEVLVQNSKINEWEELVFDFSGTASDTYNKLVLFFDFDHITGNTFYFDDIILTDDVTTEVESMKTFQKLSVYPNPATDYISVCLNSSNKRSVISIINCAGQVVLTHQSTKSPTHNISIRHLPQGIYFIKINETLHRFLKK